MKKQLITLAALAGGFVIGASALVALADWTPAPANPPSNNVAAPINVGVQGISSLQEKFDSLMIDGNLGVWGKLFIANGASTTPGSVLTNVNGDGYASWAASGGNLSYTAITPTEIFGRGFKMGDQANDGSPSTYAFPAEYFDSNSTYSNEGSYVTVSYPAGIPSNASALEVKFFAYSNGGSNGGGVWDSPTTQLWVKASNMPENVAVSAHDATQDSNADSETNTMLIPYSSDRQVQFKWNTSANSSGATDPAAVRAIVVGYIAGSGGSGSGSSTGWVTVDSGSTVVNQGAASDGTIGNYIDWPGTTPPAHTPEAMCQAAGYISFTGSCKGTAPANENTTGSGTSFQYQGSILSNTTLGYSSIACEYGGGINNVSANSSMQIFCSK